MSKQVIQGEDIILLVDNKTTLHATSHSLKVELELNDVRTKDTDGTEKYPGDVSYSIDGEGLVVINDNITDTNTPEEVLDIVLAKSLVDLVIKSPITGVMKTYTGKGYISSFTLSTTAGDNATYSYSITGSGTLTPQSSSTSETETSNE